MSLIKSLVQLLPQATRPKAQKWALQKYAEYRIRKSIKKEILERYDYRNYLNARRMRSDEETPLHQRMRWVTHQTPQSFKMDFFEAKAEEYEDLLQYKNPFADTPDGAGPVARSSGTRGMHVSEAVQVLQLTDANENHINERYNFLLAANTFKGSSDYIADKLEVAKLVALKYCRDGRLKEHIKKKPEAESASNAAKEETPNTEGQTQAEQGSENPKTDSKGEAPNNQEGSEPNKSA